MHDYWRGGNSEPKIRNKNTANDRFKQTVNSSQVGLLYQHKNTLTIPFLNGLTRFHKISQEILTSCNSLKAKRGLDKFLEKRRRIFNTSSIPQFMSRELFSTGPILVLYWTTLIMAWYWHHYIGCRYHAMIRMVQYRTNAVSFIARNIPEKASTGPVT